MENKEQDFEAKKAELVKIPSDEIIQTAKVSIESIDQLLKAHELKYLEKVVEVEEENKLVRDNLTDFLKYPEEIQREALDAYPKAQRDPDYFTRPDANQEVIKPVMILSNIEAKKNESKIKAWTVEYHLRIIARLRSFRSIKAAAAKKPNILTKLGELFKK